MENAADPHQALIDRGVVARHPDGSLRLTHAAWMAATNGTPYQENALHFVGFKNDRWWNALKTFGQPDFIHRFWDRRAVDEVMIGDVVVFAEGDETQPINPFAYDDSANF